MPSFCSDLWRETKEALAPIFVRRTRAGWVIFGVVAVFFVSEKWDATGSLLQRIGRMEPVLKVLTDAIQSPALQIVLFLAAALWIGFAAILAAPRNDQPPCSRATEDSDMIRLVRAMGLCKCEASEIRMCEYHRDRVAVEFYEQPADGLGEIHQSDGWITLDPKVAPFISRLGSKPSLAGHFGLVACQRTWLRNNLQSALATIKGRTPAILQTGTAGPVHYLGTVKIILEALQKADRKAELVTIERCCGPVLLLDAIRAKASAGAPPSICEGPRITVGRLHVCLHETVAPLLPLCSDLPELTHTLILGSLTDPTTFSEMQGKFDIVISHFLISFWQENWEVPLSRFCKEMWSSLRPDAVVLLAVGVNRHCREVQAIHDVFNHHGFTLEHAIRAWDPYDFPPDTFARLANKESVKVSMNESLCRYRRRPSR